MKALSLWEPWASLCVIPKDHLTRCDGCGATWLDQADGPDGCSCTCADGDPNYEDWVPMPIPVKWIETRPNATKVRGRIALQATKRRPTLAEMKRVVGDNLDAWNAWFAAGLVSRDGETDNMPYGYIIGHVDLYDCVPMVASRDRRECIVVRDGHLSLHVADSHDEVEGVDVSDQLPYGDFRPGRFAWLFRHAVRLETPVPFVGGQGWSRDWPGLPMPVPSEQLRAWSEMSP